MITWFERVKAKYWPLIPCHVEEYKICDLLNMWIYKMGYLLIKCLRLKQK